jgi:hypothetical protein
VNDTKRLLGFVIGYDLVGDMKVWKVRVQEKDHELNERKFAVASTHDEITLAQGLEVRFLLGTFQDCGRSVQKAVDVTLA